MKLIDDPTPEEIDEFIKNYEVEHAAEVATWPESARKDLEDMTAMNSNLFGKLIRARHAIQKHLPLLKDMASQIISPKDNHFSRMVKDLEEAIQPRRTHPDTKDTKP